MNRMAILAAFAAMSYWAFGIGASQEWVKKYVANNVGGDTVVHRPLSELVANPVRSSVVTLDAPNDNITMQTFFLVSTNRAIVAGESTVPEIPNGTVWAWNDLEQVYENVTCTNLPRFTVTDRMFTATDELGHKYTKHFDFYRCTSPTNWSSITANGKYYMIRGGNEATKLRFSEFTISDDDYRRITTPPVRTTGTLFDGRVWSAFLKACSNEGKPADANASGSITIHFTDGDGQLQFRTISFTQPSGMTTCFRNGDKCKWQTPDYSTWYDMSNWGLSFPLHTGLYNGDGEEIIVSRSKFESQFGNWNSFVDAAIEQSKASHVCSESDDDEGDDTHLCSDYRGVDCKCEYVFKYGDHKGETCGKQCDPEHVADGKRGVSGAGGGCWSNCGNPQCYKWNEATHGATEPVYGEVELPNGVHVAGGGGWSVTHACTCGMFAGGGDTDNLPLPDFIREPHDAVCVREHYFDEQLHKWMSDYVCRGGRHSCGYAWSSEDGDEHEHYYVLDDSVERCTESGDDGLPCNSVREHSFEEVVGRCKLNCLNILGSESNPAGDCGYTYHCSQDGYWTFEIDGETDPDNHYCDCGANQQAHTKTHIVADEYEFEVTNGVDVIVYMHCHVKCGACGYDDEYDEEKSRYQIEDPDEPTDHTCALDGSGLPEECEIDLEKNRGTDCKCKLHPQHQFEHKWTTFGNDGCKRCDNPDCKYNSGSEEQSDHKGWESLDTDSFAEPPFKGHKCMCKKFNPVAHNFGNGILVHVDGKDYICRQCVDCKFDWYEEKDDDECAHEYYTNGVYRSYWYNCECMNCHTNREHSFTREISHASELQCPEGGCSNKNGADYGGGYCNATTNFFSGGTHYGWIYVGDPSDPEGDGKHRCNCGAVTNAHTIVSQPNEQYDCWTDRACKAPPDGCGFITEQFTKYILHKWDYVVRNECGTICTNCGYRLKTTRDPSTGKTSNDWVKDGVTEHKFHKDSSGNIDACVCLCGMMTNHTFKAERDYCSCFCGEQIAHIAKEGECYCTGVNSTGAVHEKVLMGHVPPIEPHYIEIVTMDEVCQTCHSNMLGVTYSNVCANAHLVGIFTNGLQHVCGTNANVYVGTFTWGCGEGDTIFGEQSGSKQMSLTGFSADFENGEEHACGYALSGGGFQVDRDGWYEFQCESDDDGSFSAGPASGSSSLFKSSDVSRVKLTAGTTYPLNWHLSSVGGPSYFRFIKFAAWSENQRD